MKFEEVTEIPGAHITRDQLCRMFTRYKWTADLCKNCDVLEVACGAGQGLGLIGGQARSVHAGDLNENILRLAKAHYGDRFSLKQFDAQSLPYEDDTFDVVVIHEALYYIPNASIFLSETCRILRAGGRILLSNTNKDLYDFNPSPFHTQYHGVVELKELLTTFNFNVDFWGAQQVNNVSQRLRLFRLLKSVAVKLHMIPKTMKGKKFLKRVMFGKLLSMPAELSLGMAQAEELTILQPDIPCQSHQIIFCEGTLS